MTSPSTWKKREAQVARAFGTKRNPLSGRNSGHTASDSLHGKYFIETKLRKSHAVLRVWDKAAALAKEEGKIPMVCLTEKGKEGFWVLVKYEDFQKVIQSENEMQAPVKTR